MGEEVGRVSLCALDHVYLTGEGQLFCSLVPAWDSMLAAHEEAECLCPALREAALSPDRSGRELVALLLYPFFHEAVAANPALPLWLLTDPEAPRFLNDAAWSWLSDAWTHRPRSVPSPRAEDATFWHALDRNPPFLGPYDAISGVLWGMPLAQLRGGLDWFEQHYGRRWPLRSLCP